MVTIPHHLRVFITLGLVSLLSLVALCIAGLPHLSRSSDGPSIPKLEVEPAHIDLGVVRPGTRHDLLFKLKNTGSGVLEVGEVTVSCACEKPTLRASEIEAGGETELLVVFTPKTQLGAFRAIVYVPTNDPRLPMLQLEAVGRVEASLRVVPPRADFGEFHIASTLTVELSVLCEQGLPFDIVDITSSTPRLRMSAERPSEQSRHTVRLEWQGGRMSGRIVESVTLHTSHPQATEIVIPVVGFAAGPVRVEPERLLPSVVEGERVVERKIRLYADTGTLHVKSFYLLENTWGFAEEPQTGTLDDGSEIVLKLRVPDQPGPQRATIEIQIDSPEEQIIHLPVSVVIRPLRND